MARYIDADALIRKIQEGISGVCVGDCDLCDQGEERAIQNLCDILAGYLDRHPDKSIFSHVHIVDCKWKHEVQIVDKKAQVK